MSATSRHHLHAATSGGTDPTRTKTTRRAYAQRLRGAFADINTEIRRGVRERDVFGREGEVTADVDPLPSMFDRREDRQVETFEDWLQRMQEENVLEVIGRDENRFIESGYERGLKHANGSLRRSGIEPDETEVDAVIRRPVHRDTLQMIYTRDFSDLENITSEVSTQVTREISTGFGAGEGPNDIARRITDRVDAIGKTRATVMARTSVIDAHAAATLNRFEEHDAVEGVTVKAEWSTAADNRVCPICFALEGNVYTIEEAKTSSITLEEEDVEPRVRRLHGDSVSLDSFTGEFPVKPPAHPQCRCALLPVGGATAAAAVEAHPAAFHTLFAAGAFAGPGGQSCYEALATADAAGAQELVAQAT